MDALPETALSSLYPARAYTRNENHQLYGTSCVVTSQAFSKPVPACFETEHSKKNKQENKQPVFS